MEIHVVHDVYIHQGGESTAQILAAIADLKETTMATLQEQFQEVKDAVAQVKATMIAEKAEIQASIAALTQKVTDLEARLAAGEGVTAEDLAGLKVDLQEIDAGVKDISEPVVAVP